jgi:rhodanese-related sulfurtransferase
LARRSFWGLQHKGVLIMTDIKDSISPAHLKRSLDDGEKIELIDVRSFNEFEQIRLPSSRLIPLPEFKLRFHEINQDRNICIICKGGKRSQQACRILHNMGIEATYLEGGIDSWHKAGYPVIESVTKLKLSVEQQTRIAIGSLVLLGLLIPKFLWWLPWFVSVMLIYAGVSNSCMMMKLLAAMPWNNIK